MKKGNIASIQLQIVDSWVKTHNLALTPETTEVIVMARKRVLTEFKFGLGEIVV